MFKILAAAGACSFIAFFAGLNIGQESTLPVLDKTAASADLANNLLDKSREHADALQSKITFYEKSLEKQRADAKATYKIACAAPKKHGGLTLWAVERSFGKTADYNEFCRLARAAGYSPSIESFLKNTQKLNDWALSFYGI